VEGLLNGGKIMGSLAVGGLAGYLAIAAYDLPLGLIVFVMVTCPSPSSSFSLYLIEMSGYICHIGHRFLFWVGVDVYGHRCHTSGHCYFIC
jgi:hypothetical protein